MDNLVFDSDSQMARQVELEVEMIGLGAKRYSDKVVKALEKSNESATSYGHRLISHAVLDTAQVLEDFLAQYESGKAGRGRPHIAVKYLKQVGDMKIAAFITAKHIINGISRRNPLTTVATSIARALEDEVSFSEFAAKAPKFWKWLHEHHAHASLSHKRLVYRVALREAEEINWDGWDDKDRVHLGIKCIEAFIMATGLAQIDQVYDHKRTKTYLNPTPATLEWIENHKESAGSVMPLFLPTLVKPKPWKGPYGGGYYTRAIKPLKFVKTRNRRLLEEMKNIPDQMAPVYEAINALQDTAWKINRPVYDVMVEAWATGSDIGGLPSSAALPYPPKPGFMTESWSRKTGTKEQLAEFKKWKAQKHEVHIKEVSMQSKRIATRAMLNVADRFLDEPEFFFPYTVDFRGRTYPVSKGLDPQGDDRAKALLTFANGEPIENEEQADWLAIHGANLWGNDKVDLTSRVLWAHMNTDNVLSVVANPFEDRWWTEADKPWQFLAWCFEWAEFVEEGYGFISHLPIAMDGSCNGLQHFSAMLRDSIGGKAVNLLPAEKPQDIYADVAAKTITLLEASQDEEPMAKKWLQWGISRKDTKRSVMIVPYSGTLKACQTYILERMFERIEDEGQEDIWGDEKFIAAMYLAKKVWQAIDSTVVAARGAMNWLQGVAKVLSKEELPINWTTPDGFVVHQTYLDLKLKKISTYIDGSVIPNASVSNKTFSKLTLSIVEETDKVSVHQQRNGIAPNFVHSLDATAMRMTVVAAKKRGINSFAMIHDSFGTTAAKTSELARILREEFVGIYENHNVLEEFREEVSQILEKGELDLVPEFGDLEITDVLNSQFFFA